MRALIVEKDGSLNIREVQAPKYGPKEALVKMIACGICGTDKKIVHLSFKGFPNSAYPLILGHEGVGEVIETGSDVKGLKIGDRVLLPFNVATDEIGSAYGAIAEYAIVHDKEAYTPGVPAEDGGAPDVAYAQAVLPVDIDPVDAVMFVTFREVLSTIQYFRLKPEDSIVVYGCGPVGQVFIKFLNLLGGKDIIAVDIQDEKLVKAVEYGASKGINGSTSDVAAEVRKIYPAGVDHVLDAVGLSMVANQAMAMLKDRGNVLCYGVLAKEEITIDFSKASYNWNFICQQMPEKKEEAAAHEQVLEWVRSGKLDMKSFISDYFEFNQAVEAYEKYMDGGIMQKGIIKF